uniref:SH2 domain-containing protein n=1 Tax=Timema monikensis TaxID=170555 RepID=A0A7R9HP01_9NEOP|nr:unnamed protein product [Timema monikensis]
MLMSRWRLVRPGTKRRGGLFGPTRHTRVTNMAARFIICQFHFSASFWGPVPLHLLRPTTESVRSRVAMDFTGSVGRIVEDPKEAKAIAVAEGYSWKRRWRPSARNPASLLRAQGLESGVHMAQPWFHSGMSREQAAQLVTRHGTVDGVFLVRESRSNPGSFVLTFRCSGKVLHSQITPVMDQVRESICFSLDNGSTKFYDLLQLVEFYQLNAGCLPTRLTHYVVQSPTGPLYSEKPMGTIPPTF